VADLLARGERDLAAAGVVCAQGTASVRDEAATIVYHALGLDHDDAGAYARAVTAAEHQRCADLLRRRIEERIPSAYLVGEAWFAGLPFYVDAGVLIPRSPFAELIAARFAPWFEAPRAPRILEIGTGSGCIAVVCALAFPGSVVVATDISRAALEVARRNVRRHGLDDRVQLLHVDLLSGIRGPFDLLVSNPPYVPEAELRDMPPEFRHEPLSALAGGADGLRLVERIVRGAATVLRPEGLLAVEVGAGMVALEAAFPRVPFLWPEFEAGGDGIALVAARDLPGDNALSGQQPPGQ
jgi:ribosomal protein L3 glutamine methyltransferase